MSDFLTDLWTSVFTPGPTPTLLIATNATFGALQFLLLILLIATSSIHFVILSILCGGLWYSINWFANELTAAQAKTQAESEARASDPIDSDTETEGPPPPSKTKPKEKDRAPAPPPKPKSPTLLDPSSAAAGGASDDVRKRTPAARRLSLGDSSGDISTDSEWEKVSEGEEKAK